MNIKGFVRVIEYADAEERRLFTDRGALVLKEIARESTRPYLGSNWSIAHVEPDLLTASARFQILVGAERSGKFGDSEGRFISERNITEFEDITVYALFDVGLLLFQYPKLRTRLYTPKNLISKATSFMESVFLRSGLPKVDLQVPRKERNRSWFIKRLLEVAKNPDSRITEVKITHLHDASLSDELSIFNPDYKLEEMGRIFLPRANHGICESTHKAEEGNDLAKNPLVRGQVGAGRPSRMVVKTAPEQGRKRERKTTYEAHDGESVNISIAGRRPKLPDIIDMLHDEFRLAYGK